MADKSIITLTLVISRVSVRPAVARGLYGMRLNFFRIKREIEVRIEEYITWKAEFSTYAADHHREMLFKFCRKFKYDNVSQILREDIQSFYNEVRGGIAGYRGTKFMEAIRGFLRFHKDLHTINPKDITNTGVVLTHVEEKVIIPYMIKRKPGRPLKVELIKKVKRLKDKEKLSFRAIGRAINKDVSQVYVWYRYDLNKDSVE